MNRQIDNLCKQIMGEVSAVIEYAQGIEEADSSTKSIYKKILMDKAAHLMQFSKALNDVISEGSQPLPLVEASRPYLAPPSVKRYPAKYDAKASAKTAGVPVSKSEASNYDAVSERISKRREKRVDDIKTKIADRIVTRNNMRGDEQWKTINGTPVLIDDNGEMTGGVADKIRETQAAAKPIISVDRNSGNAIGGYIRESMKHETDGLTIAKYTKLAEKLESGDLNASDVKSLKEFSNSGHSIGFGPVMGIEVDEIIETASAGGDFAASGPDAWAKQTEKQQAEASLTHREAVLSGRMTQEQADLQHEISTLVSQGFGEEQVHEMLSGEYNGARLSPQEYGRIMDQSFGKGQSLSAAEQRELAAWGTGANAAERQKEIEREIERTGWGTPQSASLQNSLQDIYEEYGYGNINAQTFSKAAEEGLISGVDIENLKRLWQSGG